MCFLKGRCIAGGTIEWEGTRSIVWFEQDCLSSSISVSTIYDSWHDGQSGNICEKYKETTKRANGNECK